MFEKLTPTAIIIWLAFAACPALAQQPPSTTTTPTTTTASPAAETAAANLDDAGQAFDVTVTREQLRETLHRLPPEVGRVLKIDSSLWTNEAYVSNYPVLAAFLARHPEVAKNPQFYVRGLWIPTFDEAPPDTAALRMWRQIMEGFFILFGISISIITFVWLVRKAIEHRRWSRLTRIQTDVHNKLLDRFQSNEEVLRYIQTSAGRRFLEAAPIPLDAEPRAISAPVSRVLWSLQAGVILGAAGLGLKAVSFSVEKDVASALSALGVLAMAIGAGFIVSAALSYIVSRRMGIWQPPVSRTAEAHGE
jgi:hypothetical protein